MNSKKFDWFCIFILKNNSNMLQHAKHFFPLIKKFPIEKNDAWLVISSVPHLLSGLAIVPSGRCVLVSLSPPHRPDTGTSHQVMLNESPVD